MGGIQEAGGGDSQRGTYHVNEYKMNEDNILTEKWLRR